MVSGSSYHTEHCIHLFIITLGPALCLYFAALRSTGNPPSVPLPGNTGGTPLVLSAKSCPETFTNFFALWAASVAPIQSLSSSLRHDLARIICDQPPLSSNIRSSLHRIAADLRAVAIEISQRRTFQVRLLLYSNYFLFLPHSVGPFIEPLRC
jgi:hypothetical protein